MNIVARPWEPKDLIDDLQMLIDEEPDNYLNHRRTTMCMARDYLKEHFRESTKKVGWISVDERLPEDWLWVQVYSSANGTMDTDFRTPSRRGGWHHYNNITHWMPLPEPPEVEV